MKYVLMLAMLVCAGCVKKQIVEKEVMIRDQAADMEIIQLNEELARRNAIIQKLEDELVELKKKPAKVRYFDPETKQEITEDIFKLMDK